MLLPSRLIRFLEILVLFVMSDRVPKKGLVASFSSEGGSVVLAFLTIVPVFSIRVAVKSTVKSTHARLFLTVKLRTALSVVKIA